MKRRGSAVPAMLIAAALLFALIYGITGGSAAKRAAAASFTYKTYSGKSDVAAAGDSQKSGSSSEEKTVLTFSYRMPQISGSGIGIKKINSWFTQNYNEFMNSEKTFADNAKNDYQSSRLTSAYSISGKWTTQYNSSDCMSFRYVYTAFTGGTESQVITDTVTFKLNSGKQMYIMDFISGGTSKIRKRILKGYRKFEKSHKDYTMWNTNEVTIKRTPLKDLPFYMNRKKKPALYYAPRSLAPAAAGIINIVI